MATPTRKSAERSVASIRLEDEIHEALEELRCRLELQGKDAMITSRVSLSDVVRLLIVDGLRIRGVLR